MLKNRQIHTKLVGETISWLLIQTGVALKGSLISDVAVYGSRRSLCLEYFEWAFHYGYAGDIVILVGGKNEEIVMDILLPSLTKTQKWCKDRQLKSNIT